MDSMSRVMFCMLFLHRFDVCTFIFSIDWQWVKGKDKLTKLRIRFVSIEWPKALKGLRKWRKRKIPCGTLIYSTVHMILIGSEVNHIFGNLQLATHPLNRTISALSAFYSYKFTHHFWNSKRNFEFFLTESAITHTQKHA